MPLPFWPTLGAAWRLWRRNLPQLGAVALMVAVPLVTVISAITYSVDDRTTTGALLLLLVGVTVAAVGEALVAGLAEHMLRRYHQGEPRLRLRALASSLPLGTLTALAVIIAAAVAVGWVLLIVPGLAAFAWLAFAPPAASFQRLGVGAALRTSVSLVRGRFWSVAALTTATFVPTGMAEGVAAYLHEVHAPLWVQIIVDGVLEAAAISLTAAVVVVIYERLRTGAPATARARDG